MANGLLHVDLARPEPARNRRTIAIRDGDDETKANVRTIDVASRKVAGS
jgi:hypothetical protein